MINMEKVMSYNFVTDKLTDLYKFQNDLAAQPDYFVMDES